MVGGVFVVLAVSSSVGLIIFNKWLFTSGGFPYPVLLTTWHMQHTNDAHTHTTHTQHAHKG